MVLSCRQCGEGFESYNKNRKFCDRRCYSLYRTRTKDSEGYFRIWFPEEIDVRMEP